MLEVVVSALSPPPYISSMLPRVRLILEVIVFPPALLPPYI